MMVLISPTGYTKMFSFLLNHTLAIPANTAMYSNSDVALMPSIN
jgi:hypothetical protein